MGAGRTTRRKESHLGERRVVVGPILRDLLELGWDGEDAVVATAFYSERVLHSLSVSAAELQVLCRLDRDDPLEWARAMVAPDVLLKRLRAFEEKGTRISLRIHKRAHAKVYAGANGVMIGSANLTLQGFGGGWEMVQVSSGGEDIRSVRTGLDAYARILDAFTLDELEAYTSKYGEFVREYRRKHKGQQNRDKVSAPTARPPRLGDYEDFLKWVRRQSEEGAREIYERARGKGNLQGHIDRNFYGLRQFLLAYPEALRRFSGESPDTYKLSKDADTEQMIATYVRKHAADEGRFSLDVWKTYLPRECGGRAGRHGGTIGNLNRMLPLVARYLARKARQ